MPGINFQRNNLEGALSPYLRQHADNPVWWQEWSSEVIEYARQTEKLLFVSVGYSTCHWCHVMAGEAFSDASAAQYLNENFVSIKVDREERPDIDTFLMRYLIALTGSGGWPLNAFLTPRLDPVYAFTYAPLGSVQQPGFLYILNKVRDYYQTKKGRFEPFVMNEVSPLPGLEMELIEKCYSRFDRISGGFGEGPKFPPHCTLLFLLYFAEGKDPRQHEMLEVTLNEMLKGGLSDHLQGGFYRYCVDRSWTIPHFEKMLYDQALLLWVLCLGYRVLGNEVYKLAALKVIRCLEETFALDGLYRAGFDADTEHEEGATYVWDSKELSRVLTPEEFKAFTDLYLVSPEGNFEQHNHLIKKELVSLEAIENKLLAIRRARVQPFADNKLMTAWNALTGIAYVQAFRYLGDAVYLQRAESIAKALLAKHYDGVRLARCSIDGIVSQGAFCEDAAALLLLLTFLQEETVEYADSMSVFKSYLESFRRNDGWEEASLTDLCPVMAGSFDHPVPSSVALAELALARAAVLTGTPLGTMAYVQPVHHDALNIAVLVRNGSFHLIKAPVKLPWQIVPVNTIQLKGEKPEDCYRGACRKL